MMKLIVSLVYLTIQISAFRSRHHHSLSQKKQTFAPVNSQPKAQLNSIGSDFQDCSCAASFKCPTCGPNGFEQHQEICSCMPQPSCPNCVMGKILKQYHQKSAEIAKKDAQTQSKLATESMLEKKLFETAQKYAEEAAAEEKLAKEAVITLQDHASKAALARSKMIRAESQAKQVAAKALQTITTVSSHTVNNNFPQIMVSQTGNRHLAITQNTPEYQINVAVGSGDGYLDAQNQEIQKQVKEFKPLNNLASTLDQQQPVVPQQLQKYNQDAVQQTTTQQSQSGAQ